MFLIFGFRTKVHPLGWVAMVCRVCGHNGGGLLVREATKFSLFFIPLIPVRSKYVLECGNCRSCIKVSNDEGRQLMQSARPVA